MENRGIKFRAWKKTNTPEMFNNVLAVDWYNNEIKVEYDDYRIDEDVLSDFVLMQCTCLKDKNGVDVYEGDIVKFLCLNEEWNGIYKVVRANSGEWRIDNDRQGRVLYYSLENITVIGNVYNNPELIEGEC